MVVSGFGGAFCWTLILSFGFKSLVENADNPWRFVGPSLFAILSINLIFQALQSDGSWTRWFRYESMGGIFSSSVTWAAFSAISFPIIYRWNKVSSLIPVVSVLIARSSTSLLSLFASFLFIRWDDVKARWKASGLVLFVFAVIWSERSFKFLSNSFHVKLKTWVGILKAIFIHPFGIGFGFGSYEKAMLSVSSDHHAFLSHSSSDLLHFILRFGWVSVFFIISLIVWILRNLEEDEYSASIVAMAPLALFQGSISHPEVGFLAYVIFALFIIERRDHGKTWEAEKSC